MRYTLTVILSALLCISATVSVNYFSTTWAGTASNQGITFTAMNDMYTTRTQFGSTPAYFPFCTSGGIPANSLRLITKSAFTTNYCNQAGIVYIITTKTTSQILVKRDIGFSVTVYVTPSQSDCTNSGASSAVYINSDFTKAYTNSAQTTTFNGAGNSYTTPHLYVNSNIAYLVIDASGNITTFAATTC